MAHLEISQVIILSAILFSVFIFLRQILFYGFVPFLPSRPEVMERILKEVDIREGDAVYSLGYGRSGFLAVAEKRFPRAKLVGIEDSWWHFLIAKLQVVIRRSRIKVVHSSFYKADIREANVVYCCLDVDMLREMHKKLKIEPRAGAVIISMGFLIPYLEPLKVVETKEVRRWFSFLTGGHEKVLTIKQREHKKDNNFYFYEV